MNRGDSVSLEWKGTEHRVDRGFAAPPGVWLTPHRHHRPLSPAGRNGGTVSCRATLGQQLLTQHWLEGKTPKTIATQKSFLKHFQETIWQ